MVPVHPNDRSLLGMTWDGALYVDASLPFVLRSAPKIFNALADTLQWIPMQEGISCVFHYLDEFLIIGMPSSSQCEEQLKILLAVFERLDIPVAMEKLEGPTTVLIFLGIEMDTQNLTLRLPKEKLCELQGLITTWRDKRCCTKSELRSLVGKLQHACKVVRPGRSFLRQMFELLKATAKKQHFIRLNRSFRSDLAWWHLFLESWNGVTMMGSLEWYPDIHMFRVPLAVGLGGVNRGYKWPGLGTCSSGQLPRRNSSQLSWRLCYGVRYGREWKGRAILAHCDNQAVVEVVNSGYSRDQGVMQLIRCLFFIRAFFDISLQVVHIPGHLNIAADAISRNNLRVFHMQVPDAHPALSFIPAASLDGPSGTSAAGLDFPRLVPVIQDLFSAGLAESTKRVYKTGKGRYIQFCDNLKLVPFPTLENTLLLFVCHLHQQSLSHGTIKSYLAAIRFEQITRGMGNPNIGLMPRLEYMLKGAKKKLPASSRQRLPITPQILLKLEQVWQKDPARQDAKMLWAASCLCFFGFLQSGEVVSPSERTYDAQSHMCFDDIRVDNRSAPTFIQVQMKASKTDPFRHGVTIYIGATNGLLCPVAAVLSYMVERGNTPGPLFKWADSRYLTREKFVAHVRLALSAAGLMAINYAGHSFRIGAATTAAHCGIQDALKRSGGGRARHILDIFGQHLKCFARCLILSYLELNQYTTHEMYLVCCSQLFGSLSVMYLYKLCIVLCGQASLPDNI